jgi:hypothetical protein
MAKTGTKSLPKSRLMAGCFEQFDVDSLEDTLDLAERLKAQGLYRYFRGHRNANWFVESTFARLVDEESRERAREDLASFYTWVKSAPDVLPYLTHDDQIIATAQHHQIAPTPFIDFTTAPQVAAWFAAKGGVPGESGCILLVDPDPLLPIFRAINKSFDANVRFLEPDVSNLWRLQAQCGLFLEAQMRLDPLYPFDRIVFPQTGAALPVDERLIYPDRQSQLEQQILLYRKLRVRRDAVRRLLDPVDDKPSPPHIEIDVKPLTAEELELQDNRFDSVWTAGPDERWSMVRDASSGTVPVIDVENVTTGGEPLIRLVAARRHATDLLLLRQDEVTKSGSLQNALDVFWAGCRPYPYNPEQLASGLSEVVRLRRGIGDHPLDEGLDIGSVARRLLEDAVEVEIATDGGAFSRAYVGAGGVWDALTRDGRSRLGIVARPADGEALMDALAQAWGAVHPLFDPKALIALFADKIVPWQIATQREPVIFSPMHLSVLGRP